MYTVYFIFFQVASATATRYGLSSGLLGLKYDEINHSDSDSMYTLIILTMRLSTYCNSIPNLYEKSVRLTN